MGVDDVEALPARAGAELSRGQTDPELEKMNYLVEGVIGST